MSRDKTRISILGAGPAGVAAALKLGARADLDIEVYERGVQAGGNSSSFLIDGIWCDFGSHRFHPVAEEAVLDDVKSILGDDLLLRPRHGRILLQKRWIHFPLKPIDAMLRLPKVFAFSLIFDSLLKKFRKAPAGPRTFATVLEDGLGPTIAKNFYFPYVKKLWGLEPEALAVALAERRVSGTSVAKIIGKMIGQLPGLRSETAGRFFYPRKGFGQIISRYAEEAEKAGAAFKFNTGITGIEHSDGHVTAIRVEENGTERRVETDRVWSTIPISTMVRLMDPPAPEPVQAAAKAIKSRGMILIYLILETDQFTEYDAHYFPELSVPISRMSEPKNYSASKTPEGTTILCAELPADPGDQYWEMSDDELGAKYVEWLGAMGLPVTCEVRRTETRRLGHAYPVYDLDFEDHFKIMDEWIGGMKGLLTFGRQGLFAHDNTHHAFAMAYGAADCLNADGSFDDPKWAAYREVFETHVVED